MEKLHVTVADLMARLQSLPQDAIVSVSGSNEPGDCFCDELADVQYYPDIPIVYLCGKE